MLEASKAYLVLWFDLIYISIPVFASLGVREIFHETLYLGCMGVISPN